MLHASPRLPYRTPTGHYGELFTDINGMISPGKANPLSTRKRERGVAHDTTWESLAESQRARAFGMMEGVGVGRQKKGRLFHMARHSGASCSLSACLCNIQKLFQWLPQGHFVDGYSTRFTTLGLLPRREVKRRCRPSSLDDGATNGTLVSEGMTIAMPDNDMG